MRARLFPLVLWVALSVVLSGSRCGDAEALSPEVWRRDVAPAFDYGLYSDTQGRLEGERSAVLLVHRGEHLEQVYADARTGNARARVLFGQLEEATHAAGEGLADRALSLGCAALPTCTVRWSELGDLIASRGPGGVRLRQSLASGFEQRARSKQVENAVITGALSVLLAGGVAIAAEGRAAAGEAKAGVTEGEKLASETLAEQRLALPEVEGGLSLEEAAALEARFQEAEALEEGGRQSARLEVLARHRPSLQKPPPGVAANNRQWAEYVSYWERRYEELAGTRQRPAWLPAAKPPLEWSGYTSFLGHVRRALEFQRKVALSLRRECGLEGGKRVWLRGMSNPSVEENVGLAHEPGTSLTYVDQLAVDEATLESGSRPLVHSFSNKQRDFKIMSEKQAQECLVLDVREALSKYGGIVEVRRPGHPLFGRKVAISKTHLVYDGELVSEETKRMLQNQIRQYNVELHFHEK